MQKLQSGKQTQELDGSGRVSLQSDVRGNRLIDTNLKKYNNNIKILNKQSKNNNLPYNIPNHYKSYEDRLKNYIEVRNRIFGQGDNQAEFPSKVRRSRFEKRKTTRRLVVSSVEVFDSSDSKIFADIYLKDKKIRGLLDSGATVSVLGKNCLRLLDEIGVKADRYYSSQYSVRSFAQSMW